MNEEKSMNLWPKHENGKYLDIRKMKTSGYPWLLLIPIGWLAIVLASFIKALHGLVWVYAYLAGYDMTKFKRGGKPRR